MNSGSNPMIPLCNKSILQLTQTIPVFSVTMLAVQQIFCSSVVCVVVLISDKMFKEADEILSDGLLECCQCCTLDHPALQNDLICVCFLILVPGPSHCLFYGGSVWFCLADESPGRCCFSSPLLLWHFEISLYTACFILQNAEMFWFVFVISPYL